jgi:hypothetical protein
MARKKTKPPGPRARGPKNQQPVRPALFWASMALTGICVAMVVWMVIGNVPVSDFGMLPRILVIVLLFAFAAASLATTEVIPWRSRSWTEWRRPKVLGTVVYLLLGAAGFIAGVANVFNPPAADQATQIAIRDQVGEIGDDTDVLVAGQGNIAEAVGAGRASLIRRNIARVWGEAGTGCAVTYRLALHDRALRMTSLRSASGMSAYQAEYTVNAEGDRPGRDGDRISVMETREERGWFPGYSVTFTYRSNGRSETLFWGHRRMNVNGVELAPCEGGGR